MVRIKTQQFKSDNLDFKYEVNVNKDGEFTTTIPKDIVTKLTKVGIELNRNRQWNEGFFSAFSLEGLKKEVEEVANNYSEKELMEEKVVLKYSVETTCHYCRGKEGKIYPDGTWQKKAEGEEEYNWVEGTNGGSSINTDPFGFSVYVEAEKVKVWKFPNGKLKREYNNISSEDTKNDETLDWIDSIRRMGGGSNCAKEIDYSPELGLFFKNIILYICNINEKIKQTFGEEFDLSKIDLKRLPQIGFSNTKNNGGK